MIDWSSIERRAAAHYPRHFGGTTTGRITSKVPSFKELPMNVTNLNRTDLTDAERELSELVFAHYHSNPKPGQRSRVSDEFARNLRGNKERIMQLITLFAKMLYPEDADKIVGVAGLYVTQRREPLKEDGIIEMLQSVLNPRTRQLEKLLWGPVINPITDEIDPHVLWAQAYLILQGSCADVTFDHNYRMGHPAIHGEGVTVHSVNGAIIEVLGDYNLYDRLSSDFLAETQDEDGWVSPESPVL